MWTSPLPQRGDEVLTMELGGRYLVSRVQMALGPFVEGYPRNLTIETSEDGVKWVDVWSGSTAAHALEAALRSPIDVPLEIAFPEWPARFVRMRQRGSHRENTWSISRLVVLGRN
jgi:hypothetical protein